MSYDFVKAMSENLAVLYHYKIGNQVWSKCVVRKTWKCEVAGTTISKGDTAFRPITNADNRMHRISRYGMSILIKRERRINDVQ